MANNSVQLYVRSQTTGTFERIDLKEEGSIVNSDKIQEVRDIRKVFTSITTQFKAPASKNNNRAFNHLYRTDINVVDPRSYIQARLEINNGSQINGLVRVEGVKKKSGVFNEYNIRFFGELVQLPQLLGDTFLKDLTGLETYTQRVTSQQVSSMLSSSLNTPPNVISQDFTENVKFVLGAYDQVYFFDSGSDLYNTEGGSEVLKPEVASRNGVSGIEDSRLTNIANVATQGRANDGVNASQLRRSVRMSAILQALEDQVWYEGGPRVRFSKGVDSGGYPTADYGRVVQSHFFNTNVFQELFMLMHTKEVALGSDNRVNFNNVWANDLPGPDSNNTSTTISVDPYYSNRRNYKRYYVRLSVDATNNTSYRISVRTQTGDVAFTTGDVTGDFNNASNEIRVGGITDGEGAGTRVIYGDRLELANGPNTLYVTVHNLGDNDLDISSIDVSFIAEEADGGNFPFYNFTRTVTSVSNSTSAILEFNQQVPKIKNIDWLVGLWKMFNLTAYYDRDVNNDPIIVVKTLEQFYADGTERDITEYVDSQNVDIQAPSFYSDIEFSFKEPQTLLAEEFADSNDYSWGDDKYSLRTDDDGMITNPQLPKRDYKVELPFENVVLSIIGDGNPNVNDFELVFHSIVDNSYSATKIEPFLHYITLSSVGSPIYVKDDTNTQIAAINDVLLPTKTLLTGTVAVQQLSFKPEIDEHTKQVYPETLFRRFYEKYIRESFSSRSRLVKFEARLPASFIQNYTLADLITIGNDSYRINKIDVNLVNGKSMLELISLSEIITIDPTLNSLPTNPDEFQVTATPSFTSGAVTPSGETPSGTGDNGLPRLIAITASSNCLNPTYTWSTGETGSTIFVSEEDVGSVTYTVTEGNCDAGMGEANIDWFGNNVACALVNVANDIPNSRVVGESSSCGLNVGDAFELTVSVEPLSGFEFVSGPFKIVNGIQTSSGTHTFAGTIQAGPDGLTAVSTSESVGFTGTTRATFQPIPPMVSTVNATGVLEDEMSLNGFVTNNGGDSITQAGFIYRQGNLPLSGLVDVATGNLVSGATMVSTPSSVEEAFSVFIDMLMAGTEYTFVAFAVNSAGTGYGRVMVQETNEAGTPSITFQRCDDRTQVSLSDLDPISDTYCVEAFFNNLPDTGVITSIQYITGGTGWILNVDRIGIGQRASDGMVSNGNVWDIEVGDFRAVDYNEPRPTNRVASIRFTNPGTMTSAYLHVSQQIGTLTLTAEFDRDTQALLMGNPISLLGGVGGIEVTSRGGTDTNYSVPWEVSNSADIPSWLTLTPTSAFGSTTVTFNVAPNVSGATRDFEIAFQSTGSVTDSEGNPQVGSDTLTISQAISTNRTIDVYLLDSMRNRRLNTGGGGSPIGVSQLTVDGSGGFMSNTTADSACNCVGASGDIEVVVTPNLTGVRDGVNLSQFTTQWRAFVTPITGSDNEGLFTGNWITLSRTSGVGSEFMDITVEANTPGMRVATITFQAVDPVTGSDILGLTDQISVTQAAGTQTPRTPMWRASVWTGSIDSISQSGSVSFTTGNAGSVTIDSQSPSGANDSGSSRDVLISYTVNPPSSGFTGGAFTGSITLSQASSAAWSQSVWTGSVGGLNQQGDGLTGVVLGNASGVSLTSSHNANTNNNAQDVSVTYSVSPPSSGFSGGAFSVTETLSQAGMNLPMWSSSRWTGSVTGLNQAGTALTGVTLGNASAVSLTSSESANTNSGSRTESVTFDVSPPESGFVGGAFSVTQNVTQAGTGASAFSTSDAGISFSVSRAGTVSLSIATGTLSGTNFSDGQELGTVSSETTHRLSGSITVPNDPLSWSNFGETIAISGISAVQAATVVLNDFESSDITVGASGTNVPQGGLSVGANASPYVTTGGDYTSSISSTTVRTAVAARNVVGDGSITLRVTVSGTVPQGFADPETSYSFNYDVSTTQTGLSNTAATSGSFSSDSVSFEPTMSGSRNVSVTANGTWSITGAGNAISVSPSSGSNGTTQVTITYDGSTIRRNGMLTLTSDDVAELDTLTIDYGF